MTTIFGFLVAFIGFEVSRFAESMVRFLSSTVLIMVGAAYMILDLRSRHSLEDQKKVNLSDKVAILALVGMLTFSPCVAIIPIFFAAGPMGLAVLVPLSIVLTAATLGGMVLITGLAYTGVEKLRFSKIEEHEHLFLGAVLVILGIAVIIFG